MTNTAIVDPSLPNISNETKADEHQALLTRRAVAAKDYKGQGYTVDPKIDENGPMKERGCTDCICLLILFAFIGVLAYTVDYSLQHEQIDVLLAPVD